MGKTPKSLASPRSRPYNYRRNQHGQNSNAGSQRYSPQNYSHSTEYVPRRISPYRLTHQYRSQRFANQSYAFGVTQAYRNRNQGAFPRRGGLQPVYKRIPQQRRVKKRNMQPQIEPDQQERAIEESSEDIKKQDIAIENGTSSTKGLEQVTDSVDNHNEIDTLSEEKRCGNIKEDGEEAKASTPRVKNNPKEKKTSKTKTSLRIKREQKKFNNDEENTNVQNSDSTEVDQEVVVPESGNCDANADAKVDKENRVEPVDPDFIANHDALLGNKRMILVLPQIEVSNKSVHVVAETQEIVSHENEGDVNDMEKLSLSTSSAESFNSTLSPQIKESTLPPQIKESTLPLQIKESTLSSLIKESTLSPQIKERSPRRSMRFVTASSDSSSVCLEKGDVIEAKLTPYYTGNKKIEESYSLTDKSFGNSIRAISSRRPIRDSYSNYSPTSLLKRNENLSFKDVTSPKEDQETTRHVPRISHESSSVFEAIGKESEEVDVSNLSDDCSGISEASNISTDPPSETAVTSSYRKRKADILENKHDLKKLKSQQYPSAVMTTQNTGFLSKMSSPLYLFKNKMRNETIISSSNQLETIEREITVEEKEESLIIDGEFSTQNIQQKEFISPCPRDGINQGISGHRKWCVIM